MTPPSSSAATGWREIPPPQARPAPVPRALRAPLAVRGAVVLPDLEPDVWAEAVVAAERVFGRAGVLAGAGDHRRWTAGPAAGRRTQARMSADGVAGGVRVEVEHVRAGPRPWPAAACWLCAPAAAVVAVVLSGRAASLAEWGVVAVLGVAPAVLAVWIGAAEWTRSLAVLRNVRRVLAATEQAAWQARAVWVEAHDAGEDDGRDVEPEAIALPPVSGPGLWLDLDEIDGLAGARPAPPVARRPRPPSARADRSTADRDASWRGAAPEGFADWRPTSAAP